MSAKSDREAARQAVGAYHESQLRELVERVGATIDPFRAGGLGALRAAKELCKFCNFGDPELGASTMRERPTIDWWERGVTGKH